MRTNDLNNLLNSTDVATLFLDRNLCIRWFTPSMKTLLELLPSDIGRPMSHFAQRFKGGDLLEDARKVLERLLPSDIEVVDDLGRWYIRRILPYRSDDDRIDGVAVTFTGSPTASAGRGRSTKRGSSPRRSSRRCASPWSSSRPSLG